MIQAHEPAEVAQADLPALEPVTASLEPLQLVVEPVEPVELHGRARARVRLVLREFTPFTAVAEVGDGVELSGAPRPAVIEVPARLLGAAGRRASGTHAIACSLELVGWVAVSGDLGSDRAGHGGRPGPRVGVARLRLRCDRSARELLGRVYQQLRFPCLAGSGAGVGADAGSVGPDRLRRLAAPRELGEPLPASLGVDAVGYAQGTPLGQARVVRAYANTWTLTSLRWRDPELEDPSRVAKIRTALYHHIATAPLLLDGHTRQHLLTYFDRDDPWHQATFEGFAEWFDDEREATVVGFDRFALARHPGDGSHDWAHESGPEVDVDQVRPDELDAAVAILQTELSGLACAAFDIDANRLDRVYLHPSYASHGIARGRRVFGVRESSRSVLGRGPDSGAGALVGLALCEAGQGDDSLGLGELGDLAQLVFTPQASQAGRRALVEYVRGHYAALGRPEPTVLARSGAVADPAAVGLVAVESLGCMIWTGRVLRAFRTFLRTTLARLTEQEAEACARARASSRARTQPPASPSPSWRRATSWATPDRLERDYESTLAAARARPQTDPRLAPLLQGSLGPIALLGSLLHGLALGHALAAGGESLRRAGHVCAARGQTEVARLLAAAAERVVERGRLGLDDLFALAQRWRDEIGARVDVDRLLHQPPPRALLRLLELGERLADGKRPALALVVAHELEQASAGLAPQLERACEQMFGGDLGLACVRLNADSDGACGLVEQRRAIVGLLAEPRTTGPTPAEIGRAALNHYVDLLGDCVVLGRELADRVHAPAVAGSRGLA